MGFFDGQDSGGGSFDLLSQFSNPQFMKSILGLNGGGASPQFPDPQQQQPQPPAQPPQDWTNTAPPPPVPQQTPQSVGQMASMQPPMPPPQGNGAPSIDEAGMASGMPQNVPMPPAKPADSFDQRFAAATPQLPIRSPQATDEAGIIAAAPGMSANAQAPVPLPPPKPPMPPGAMPPGGATPMPPAAPPGAMPPTMGQGGGLAAALGIDPSRLQAARQGDALRANMAAVGKGLSAVGSAPAGTNKGQMFARGAGGSLEGQAAAEDKQKNDLFNQTSTAFKDMLAAKTSDNTEEYRKAQSQYLSARAQSLQAMTAAGGGKASNAWQNTTYGKVIGVENESQKFEKGQQILLQKRWTLNGSTPEEQQKDLDALGKKVEQYRSNLYKQSGIDPKQADKIKDMGTTQDNPFDTKGMSIDQFHSQVPMGGWFKDQNGVVRQRTVPPPGSRSDAPGAPNGAAPPSTAANTDDQEAMTPAA